MENRTSSRKTRVGLVVSDKMDKTVVVAIADRVAHPLYKKIVGRTYKLKAHDEQNADENGRDQQRIAQRRAGFLLDRHADGVAEDGQEHPGQGRSQNFSHGRMPPHFHDAGA